MVGMQTNKILPPFNITGSQLQKNFFHLLDLSLNYKIEILY